MIPHRLAARSLPLLACLVLLPSCRHAAESAPSGVRIEPLPDRLAISINGQPFTEYRFKGASRPYLYPLLGPGGLRMTRHYPMEKFPNEEEDHIHHRSFWFAHGDANGHDFWSESPKAGRTVHQEFLQVRSGRDAGTIRSRNQWIARDGSIVATDERTLRIYARNDERLFDFEITIHASHGDLTLGDTKEGTMALRLAETMRLKGKVGQGHIVNSEGVRDGDTWGKRARWVDYHGPVDGQLVGVAIFDHPSNPRHPTWWHVRDYGLFAANPFGVHDFEKQPAGTGNLKIPAGRKVTFRYRFLLHRGDARQAAIEQRYDAYVKGNL